MSGVDSSQPVNDRLSANSNVVRSEAHRTELTERPEAINPAQVDWNLVHRSALVVLQERERGGRPSLTRVDVS